MREEVLQRSVEEANLQAEDAAVTEHGIGEKEPMPTETECASQRLPADLILASFEVKTEDGKSRIIDVHSCGTVQSIIDEIKQSNVHNNGPLKLFQDDTILPLTYRYGTSTMPTHCLL